MLRRMDDRMNQLLATGAKVILLLEPPSVHAGSQTQPDSGDIAYEHMNDLLRIVAARHPHRAAVVNLEARVCPSGPPCPYVVPGFGSTTIAKDNLRPDDIHYQPAGSVWVARWLVPQLATAARGLS